MKIWHKKRTFFAQVRSPTLSRGGFPECICKPHRAYIHDILIALLLQKLVALLQ